MSSSDSSRLLKAIHQLTDCLNKIEPFGLQQLEEWRVEAHLLVDQFCETKRDNLFEFRRDVQHRELEHLQHKVERLITDHHLTGHKIEAIEHEISMAQVKLNEFEHLRITTRPLIIDHRLIFQRTLFPLAHAHRTLQIKSGNECPIGSNEQHLLIDREEKHLTLLDHHLNIVREIPFTHNGIHGICWSTTLRRFIIILFKEIFKFNEDTMAAEPCPIVNDIDWWRGTCSDSTLFLSTVEWGSSIHEFDLRSSFQPIRQWHSPMTCAKDEIICDLKYANDHLAIPISNRTHDTSRIELRSVTTLVCIWSIPIHGRCRCCSINGDQWLVMDHDDCQFFHISADGRLLKKDKYEHHQQVEDLIPWGENQLVVLTKKSINLHELS